MITTTTEQKSVVKSPATVVTLQTEKTETQKKKNKFKRKEKKRKQSLALYRVLITSSSRFCCTPPALGHSSIFLLPLPLRLGFPPPQPTLPLPNRPFFYKFPQLPYCHTRIFPLLSSSFTSASAYPRHSSDAIAGVLSRFL